LKNRLEEGGEELEIMRVLNSGARIIGIPTDNKGNVEYLVWRDGDGLIDKVNRNELKKRVFAEAMSEWKTEQNTLARKLERSGLNYEFGFENLRGFKAEKREEFNLIDQTRQRGRGRACNLTDIDVLDKYMGDLGLLGNVELMEFIGRYSLDMKGRENLGKKKQVMCVALELVMRQMDLDGRNRGEPRVFFNLEEDIVLKKALNILSGKAT
jgi:hypothetical protein